MSVPAGTDAPRGAHRPFFIMGSPRSGTTLVGQILDGHSRLAVYLEMNYYSTFGSIAHLYGDLGHAGNRRRFVGDVLQHLRIQHADPPTIDEVEAALVAPTFAGVLDTLLAIYARQRGKVRGGDKTPLNYLSLPEILGAFTDSPIVYLMRDPRDVVLSMRKAWNASIAEATRTWNTAFLRLTEAPTGRVHVVRYEELVEDPAAVTRQLCVALSEEYEPGMIDLVDRVPEQLKVLRHLDLAKLDGPVVASSVGSHTAMSGAEVREIEARCAMGMEAMGYAFSGPRPTIAPPLVDGPGFARHAVDRLRYYGRNRERWRRGAFRWRMMLRVGARYVAHRAVGRDAGAPVG